MIFHHQRKEIISLQTSVLFLPRRLFSDSVWQLEVPWFLIIFVPQGKGEKWGCCTVILAVLPSNGGIRIIRLNKWPHFSWQLRFRGGILIKLWFCICCLQIEGQDGRAQRSHILDITHISSDINSSCKDLPELCLSPIISVIADQSSPSLCCGGSEAGQGSPLSCVNIPAQLIKLSGWWGNSHD